MALVAGSGAMGKNKNIKLVLSGFAGTGTSQFGEGSDINCSDVEYLSITKPEKSENEATEIQTNMRTIKDDVPNKGWEDWSGAEIFNDENGTNWKAFVAAQETDATGTVTLLAGTSTMFSMKAKVSKAGGGGGDASSFDTSFTPTFRFLDQGTGTATA